MRNAQLIDKYNVKTSMEDTSALTLSAEDVVIALATAASGIMITDRHGVIQWVNPAVTTLTGYSAKEILGNTPKLFKSGRHTPAIYRDLWDTILAGKTWRGTFINRRKDGSIYHDEHTVTPMRGANGEAITHFIAIMHDVTASQQAEEAIRQLADIVESSNDAIIGESLDGTITSWNPAAEKIFGYTAAEMIGRSLVVLLPPDRSTEERTILDRILHGNDVLHLETRRMRKDGVQIDVVVTVSPIRDAKGNIVGASKIARDVTARKRTEEALLESQALYHSLVEHMPAGVFRKDAGGRYVFVNSVFCRLKCMRPNEILGKTPLELAAYEAASENARSVDVKRQRTLTQGADHHEWIMRTGRCVELEEVYPHPDGTGEYFQVVKSPVFGPDGRAIGSQGMQFDITARKRAEFELEQTNNQLLALSRQAGIAEFATGVLHNVGNVLTSVNVASACLADSLRKSKSSSLSKVVALISEHGADLSAFFTSDPKGKQVPGYLAQLAQHLKREQASALDELAQLQKNIGHIKDIVTMQQSLGKVAGGSETLKVTDLVEGALRMNASSLMRSDIQVIEEFEEMPPIVAEKHKLLQILVNLVRNAMQACDESGCREKRLTLRLSQASGRVRIAVADNGCGISVENLAKIFTHGFTTKKDGHGFGLHSAILAAREMGGSLTVHSDGPGRGATFTLELPAVPPNGNPTPITNAVHSTV